MISTDMQFAYTKTSLDSEKIFLAQNLQNQFFTAPFTIVQKMRETRLDRSRPLPKLPKALVNFPPNRKKSPVMTRDPYLDTSHKFAHFLSQTARKSLM